MSWLRLTDERFQFAIWVNMNRVEFFQPSKLNDSGCGTRLHFPGTADSNTFVEVSETPLQIAQMLLPRV